MFEHVNVVATAVFAFFFGLVSVLGFVAARWKAAGERLRARSASPSAAPRPGPAPASPTREGVDRIASPTRPDVRVRTPPPRLGQAASGGGRGPQRRRLDLAPG